MGPQQTRQVDLTKLSVTELKALKCDLMDQMQQLQQSILVLSQTIALRLQEPGKAPALPAVPPKKVDITDPLHTGKKKKTKRR